MQLSLEMPIRRVLAHPNVEDCQGKVVLERGPIVYAVEGVDHDGTVSNITLSDTTALSVKPADDLLGGVQMITADGLQAIPYYAWAHRGITEMAVWLNREA